MNRGAAGTGLVAVPVAMATTTVVAALARAAGVDFELPDGGQPIPLPGFAVATGFFSLLAVGMALVFRRWSRQPAEQFTRTAVALTGISFVPPFLVGATTVTAVTLVGLHLVPAVVMIPTLARSLKPRTVQGWTAQAPV